MRCPKCDKEMESGILQAGGRLIWTTKNRKFSSLRHTDTSYTILSERFPLLLGKVPSYRCQTCGFILTQIPPQGQLKIRK